MRGDAITELGASARMLRTVHSSIGMFELGCLAYLWFCAITRRRDRWFNLAVRVLFGEGVALLLARGCPLGFFQRRAGDDVPMFELWFGPQLARYAIPSFVALAVSGMVTALVRSPHAQLTLQERLVRVGQIGPLSIGLQRTDPAPTHHGDSSTRWHRDGP